MIEAEWGQAYGMVSNMLHAPGHLVLSEMRGLAQQSLALHADRHLLVVALANLETGLNMLAALSKT